MAATKAWRGELDDLLRGVAGGMLIGIPLLYTMEVWWRGAEVRPSEMALMVIATFVPVVGLIATSGFRRTGDIGFADIATDTLEAVALALLCVLLTTAVLGVVAPGDPLRLVTGAVVTEMAPFAIGVALARVVLAQGGGSDEDDAATALQTGDAGGDGGAGADGGDEGDGGNRALNRTVADLGGAVVGVVVIGLSIAPTDEVPMLAAARSPSGLLLIVALSLVVSYVIVFAAGFGDQQGRSTHRGVFQHPITETVAAYLVALVLAAVMLAFFGRIRFDDPIRLIVEHVVVLGLPACVGGAAGRLAV